MIKEYEEALKLAKATVGKVEFKAQITSITNGGLVTVTFSDQVQLNFNGRLEDVTEDIFKISITGNPKFTWSAIIGGQVLEIQLVFEEPDKISLNKKDQIKVQIYNEILFSDKNAHVLVTKIMEHELPEQVDSNDFKEMVAMAEALEKGT